MKLWTVPFFKHVTDSLVLLTAGRLRSTEYCSTSMQINQLLPTSDPNGNSVRTKARNGKLQHLQANHPLPIESRQYCLSLYPLVD